MKSHTEMVKEFHDTFGVSTPRKPVIPHEDIRFLRDLLIREENEELLESVTTVEALDAIADLLYVVHGAALAYGFTPEQVDAAFREAHRSNMSKTWLPQDVSLDGANLSPLLEDAEEITLLRGINRYVVKRADGKVLKSPSYSPANLEPIVNGGSQ